MAIAQQAEWPNRTPEKPKKPRFAHTANTKYGMGENMGGGVKQKLGTMRKAVGSVGMAKISNKGMKTPPKSVV